jgi:xanthine dehydrogenase small subunit
MTLTRFLLNLRTINSPDPPGLPLLDLIRGHERLTGTKEGCREGDCGACAVLVGEPRQGRVHYRMASSCLLPIAAVEGCHVVTVEGLSGEELTPLQEAFVREGAAQCGFCTPGFMVAATGFLLAAERFDRHEAMLAIAGNICRCTGYASIRRAFASVLDLVDSHIDIHEDRVPALIREGLLPPWFAEAPGHLAELARTAPPEDAGAAHLVGGGTDQYVQRPDELRGSSLRLVRAAVASGVWLEGDEVVIGAATTVEELRRDPLIARLGPRVARCLELFGSRPIRERATVGGNLVNASPIGDLTILLLALGAEVRLEGPEGHRSIPLDRLYLGYKQLGRAAEELLTEVRFDARHLGARIGFEKVCKRTHLDIATVNTALVLHGDAGHVDEVLISAGGVAPVPRRLASTEAVLTGRPLEPQTISKALQTAISEVAPIDDIRGSAGYKRLLLQHLLVAHLDALLGLGEALLEVLPGSTPGRCMEAGA